MVINNTPENHEYLKAKLMKELKAYRNISIKLAILAWTPTFAGHLAYTVICTDPLQLQLDEMLIRSFIFSLVFALIGYCLGSVLGAHLQKARLHQIRDKRYQRKRFIEEQVAIREMKLENI